MRENEMHHFISSLQMGTFVVKIMYVENKIMEFTDILAIAIKNVHHKWG